MKTPMTPLKITTNTGEILSFSTAKSAKTAIIRANISKEEKNTLKSIFPFMLLLKREVGTSDIAALAISPKTIGRIVNIVFLKLNYL